MGSSTSMPYHPHGRAGLPDLAHAEDDAADQAAADQARGLGRRSPGTTSPAATRPSTSCARWSSSCATPSASSKLGAQVPKGILLHGPPGTGKTLLAKAVAHESGAHFFSQSASSFVEMFAGLGAARIRRLFRSPEERSGDHLHRRARRGRRASAASTSRARRTRRSTSCWSRWTASRTRRPDRDRGVEPARGLDPALLRPGRFDRQVLVSPPDMRGREQILQVHTRDKPIVADVDLELVARQTSGPDRRRPRQPLQRGRDLRRAARTAT